MGADHVSGDRVIRRALAAVVLLASVVAGTGSLPAAAQPGAGLPLAELEALKQQLTAPVLVLPGALWIDADEATNEIAVGVDPALRTPELEAAITSFARDLGLPSTLLRFEEGAGVSQMDLDDRHRPTVGGLQIQFQRGFLGLETGTCTFGFGARALPPAPSVFITNSHCSRTQGGNDNGRYWSPTRPPSDGDQIGTENHDPSYATGGSCPSGRRCRRSDAATVQSTQAGAAQVGHIARVPAGSTSWDGSSTYRITAKGGAVAVNTTVLTKVGRTTGRTSGTVTNTCVNTNVTDTDITLLCQNFVLANVEPGDSGSPVFAVTNSPQANDTTLHGILWGRATNAAGQVFFAYSPIANIEQELGTLDVLG